MVASTGGRAIVSHGSSIFRPEARKEAEEKILRKVTETYCPNGHDYYVIADMESRPTTCREDISWTCTASIVIHSTPRCHRKGTTPRRKGRSGGSIEIVSYANSVNADWAARDAEEALGQRLAETYCPNSRDYYVTGEFRTLPTTCEDGVSYVCRAAVSVDPLSVGCSPKKAAPRRTPAPRKRPPGRRIR